jgi:hypothetical protein
LKIEAQSFAYNLQQANAIEATEVESPFKGKGSSARCVWGFSIENLNKDAFKFLIFVILSVVPCLTPR